MPPSACRGEEEGGETGALCLPAPPRNLPQPLPSQPRKPLPGSGVCSTARQSWGLLQPLEREELRPQRCPWQPPVLSAPEEPWSSPGVRGQTLTLPPREGAGLGLDPRWLHRPLFRGFRSRVGFSLSLQTALVCQNSKTSAKCLSGYSHVAGWKVCWEVLHHFTRLIQVFICLL